MPRFLHKLYAHTANYFWLPCPRCGQMFGGHESAGTDWILDGKGRMTCSDCPGDRTLIDGEWREGYFTTGQDGELLELRTL